MFKRTVLTACLLVGVGLSSANAATLFKYTFDNRTAPGTEVKRPYDSVNSPYDGEDYVPDPLSGEFGPTLANPGPGGANYRYRSYYSNDVAGVSDGREVLKLTVNHPHSQDLYRSVTGTGTMPTTGSFTWEMVVRIDGSIGVTTGGRTNVASLFSTAGKEFVPSYDRGRGASLQVYNTNRDGSGKFDLGFRVVKNVWGHAWFPNVSGLNLGQYYHLAAVYDDVNSQMMLYVDGNLVASEAGQMYDSGRKSDYWLFGADGSDGTVRGTIFGYIDSVSACDAALDRTGFVTYVPEPCTMGLVLLASGGLGAYLRRRRNG